MTREKPISFRPTPDALLALAEIEKVHGSRSKAINAALVAAGVLSENGLKLPKPIPAKPDTRSEITAGGPGSNTGHGHVWERPDGVKARCGGPGICSECSKDAAEWPELWAAKAADKKPRTRRTKTNATIAPPIVGQGRDLRIGPGPASTAMSRAEANAPTVKPISLRRRIPKPAWKG